LHNLIFDFQISFFVFFFLKKQKYTHNARLFTMKKVLKETNKIALFIVDYCSCVPATHHFLKKGK